MFEWIAALGLNETELKKFLMKKKDADEIDNQILANKECIAELYVQINALEEKNNILSQRKSALNEFANTLSNNLFAPSDQKAPDEQVSTQKIIRVSETIQEPQKSEEILSISYVTEEISSGTESVDGEQSTIDKEIAMSLPESFLKQTQKIDYNNIVDSEHKSNFTLGANFSARRTYNGLKGDPEFKIQLQGLSKNEVLSRSLGMN